MKVLIVVDMQNDFVTGALGTPEARAIVPNVAAKIAEYRKNGDIIIFTKDTHYFDYMRTVEGKYLPVEHCIVGTPGHEIIPELELRSEDYCTNKNTFGAYDLADTIDYYIQRNKDIEFNEEIESIELIGVCTDICVISNTLILKANFWNTPIIVDASCCAGTTPEMHENALKIMKSCHVEVINHV